MRQRLSAPPPGDSPPLRPSQELSQHRTIERIVDKAVLKAKIVRLGRQQHWHQAGLRAGQPKFKGQFGSRNPFDWRSLTSGGWGGYLTNQFPSHVSTVPFVWEYFGTRHDMAFAAGVTGIDFDDDKFLAPPWVRSR